jgi:hypothetical protein
MINLKEHVNCTYLEYIIDFMTTNNQKTRVSFRIWDLYILIAGGSIIHISAKFNNEIMSYLQIKAFFMNKLR